MGGTATYNISMLTSGNRTLTISDIAAEGLTTYQHSAITILPKPTTKLQLLLPGETATPGNTGNAGGMTEQQQREKSEQRLMLQ